MEYIMEKQVYMVHKEKRAAFTYNKQQAIKAARKHSAKVRRMSYWLFNQCSSWDLPTFYAQSDNVEV